MTIEALAALLEGATFESLESPDFIVSYGRDLAGRHFIVTHGGPSGAVVHLGDLQVQAEERVRPLRRMMA
jgi:hypothetical protein